MESDTAMIRTHAGIVHSHLLRGRNMARRKAPGRHICGGKYAAHSYSPNRDQRRSCTTRCRCAKSRRTPGLDFGDAPPGRRSDLAAHAVGFRPLHAAAAWDLRQVTQGARMLIPSSISMGRPGACCDRSDLGLESARSTRTLPPAWFRSLRHAARSWTSGMRL